MLATVTGTIDNPEIRVKIDYNAIHLPTRQPLREYVKAKCDARWDKTANEWVITGTPRNPDQFFARCGIQLRVDQIALPGINNASQLQRPFGVLAANGRQVHVHARMTSRVELLHLLGYGALWDRDAKVMTIPVNDVYLNGLPRPEIEWSEEAQWAGYRALTAQYAVVGLEPQAEACGRAAFVSHEFRKWFETSVASMPEWWSDERQPFPHQIPGAISAVLGHRLISDPPGVGKAQPLSSLVLTPTGFIRMGDIKIGTEVVSPDGTTVQVDGVFPQGVRDVYRVTLEDGRSILADGQHIWTVSNSTTRRDGTLNGNTTRHKTTLELLGDLHDGSGKRKWSIESAQPVDLGAWSTAIDPYLLGVLLGDGCLLTGTPMLTNADQEILNRIGVSLAKVGVSAKQSSVSKILYSLSKFNPAEQGPNLLTDELRRIGVHGHLSKHKFIPQSLLHSDVHSRHALIQGLLDTDGTPAGSSGCSAEFAVASRQLSKDFAWLVHSLGGRCYQTSKWVNGVEYFRSTARLPDEFPPFRLKRKLAQSTRSAHRNCNGQFSIAAIEPVGSEQVQCIRVNSSLHEYVTDGFVRTHNTSTAIMCAGYKRSRRILVACPPKLSLNWGREFEATGYPYPVRVFRAGPLRKRDKEPLPDKGVVVVGDSLLASRPALREQLIAWAPDFFAVDEIHRLKSLSSKRTQAVLDIAHHVPVSGRYGLTGTPIISGLHEMVPILEFTGHLGPVFGGAHAFLSRFCTYFEKFKSFTPRKHALPELNMLLNRHVWVRRPKFEVLKQLRRPISSAIELDVDVTAYKEAHAQVIEKLESWVDDFVAEWGMLPDEEAVESYLELCAVGHVSHLRLASAVTKLETAKEIISDHVVSDPENESPLIVWVHHKEVQLALAEQLEGEEIPYRMIVGGQSQKQSQESVDLFQAGQVRVLIASITAAGVGLTLTKTNEMIFVETDWTPAIVSQAIDRANRIGQTRAVITRTLVALGTLDEHIQRIQQKKGAVASVVHGDDLSDVAVLHSQDLATPREIIRGLLEPLIAKRRKVLLAA